MGRRLDVERDESGPPSRSSKEVEPLNLQVMKSFIHRQKLIQETDRAFC
jgi:hypothetical protein